MTDRDRDRLDGLRRRAEEAVRFVETPRDAAAPPLSPAEIGRLVQDVWVYRIELEVQNAALRDTQAELAASRDRYVELFDLAPIGYVTIDDAGVIVQANLTAARMLGHARPTLIGHALGRSVASADRDAFHRFHRKLVGAGAPTIATLRLARSDGSTFHARLDGVPGGDDAGTCRLTITDVEEETVAEAQLQLIFEHVPDGILLIDATTQEVVAANPTMCSLIDRDAAAVRRLGLIDLHPPDDHRRLTEQLAGNDLALVSVMARRADGTVFPVDVQAAHAEIASRPMVLACYRDVTEKHRLVAKAAQAERLASLGLLAAGISHEINNPLTAILFELDRAVAEDRQLGRDDLHQMVGGLRRISALIHDLGVFARRDPIPRVPVDVHACIARALAQASSQVVEVEIVEALGTVPPVLASEGELVQVLLSVFLDAIDAMQDVGVDRRTLHVATRVDAERVVVEVSDSGPAIAPGDLDRVLEPYFATRRVHPGAGLSLAMCKSIVVGMGGELTVASGLDRGRRFLFDLPAAPTAPSPPAAIAPEPSAPERGRLLVIDDEVTIRNTLARLLGADHDVVTAPSGVEAKAVLAHDQDFDLILCDVMMPRMTGFELHAWLAQAAPEVAARVVFISGGIFTSGASAYLASIPNQLLEKPFENARVRALAHEMVRARRRRGG